MAVLAHWHGHVNVVGSPRWMRHWLTDGGSLTAKLVAHDCSFHVRRLRQDLAPCLPDECSAIGLARPVQVRERDVLLCLGDRAVVFAHTVIPLRSSASDWPFFSALGERSLGSTLFADPLVRRGRFEFARLPPAHPLARRAAAAIAPTTGSAALLYARRSLFRRRHGVMLVTEVFLPEIVHLSSGPPFRQSGQAAVVID